MQFFSTRDQNRKVTSSEAIAQGLSNEGGLFVPESFPQVDVKALCELDYPAMAAAVIKEYLTDYSQDFLTEAARSTYGDAFGGKAGYLVPVEGDTYALELWHGPTCAFKDYALQLMPKLLVEAKKNLGRTEKTLILVATSGDTGKAALDGYHDIPGVPPWGCSSRRDSPRHSSGRLLPPCRGTSGPHTKLPSKDFPPTGAAMPRPTLRWRHGATPQTDIGTPPTPGSGSTSTRSPTCGPANASAAGARCGLSGAGRRASAS